MFSTFNIKYFVLSAIPSLLLGLSFVFFMMYIANYSNGMISLILFLLSLLILTSILFFLDKK